MFLNQSVHPAHPDEAVHRHPLTALCAMYVGLLLTLGAAIAPHVDRRVGRHLARHLESAYPAYTQDRIDSAVTTWLVILTVVGLIGAASWAGSIWSVSTRKQWARWVATAAFLFGTGLALAALLTRDTSGEVGLTPMLGWIGMLPCLAGAVAVSSLWRPTSRDPQASSRTYLYRHQDT